MAATGTPVGPFPPGSEPDEYDRLRRRVLWMMPSGLYLLGARVEGEANLMALNWATQVSFDPKLVAVSVEAGAVTHRLVAQSGAFALSVLARADRTVVRRFVKPAELGPGPSELNGFAVRTATTGAPILTQAVAWLDCEVTTTLECGGHTLFVGQVVDAGSDIDVDEPAEVLRMEDTRMNYGG